MRTAVLTVLLCLLLPASALAVSAEGEGVNVRHLRNIPHTVQPNDGPQQQGTDFEMATITVAGPPAGTPAAPATPVSPVRTAPKTKAKPRYRYVKRCKTVKRGGKKRRVCKRVKVRVKPKARKSDADPHTPGVQKTFAFAGSYYHGVDVIDITDPEDAQKVAAYDCGIGQGDVQVFRRDGRWFLAYAQDDGYTMYESTCTREATALGFQPTEADGGTYIIEVTDPYKPKLVSFISMGETGLGSHNVTVHPGGRYLYNSNADLITSPLPAIEIVDLADLSKPKKIGEYALQTFPGLGTEAHDVTFNAKGDRAYVAALSHGEILDTTDPAAPKTLGTVVDPALNVWHQMEAIEVEDPTLGKRSFLIAEDEFAGAEHTGQCPNGGLHVYDVTDPALPIPVGVYNIDEVRPTDPTDPDNPLQQGRCTSHVFQIDHEAQIMTMGWYNAGVRILDLSALAGIGIADQSPMGIKQLGYFQFQDTDAWAAKAIKADRKGFHFFANDKRRGFDVYRYQPEAGARANAGVWLTPAEALRRNRAAGAPSLSGICFLPPGKI